MDAHKSFNLTNKKESQEKGRGRVCEKAKLCEKRLKKKGETGGRGASE